MQKPKPAAAPAYPIASVDNALRLLVLFRDRPRVRLSEASEYLGVAHSTAHRLMAMLAFHGFVRQEADSRAYVAGPVLTEIGLAAVRELDIRRHARPALEQLAAVLGETVHLAVLEGGSVRYLDAVESPRALRVAARTGTALAANCTASGKALLAELTDAQVTALLGGADGPGRAGPGLAGPGLAGPGRPGPGLAGLTGRSITGLPQLLAELGRVRARGYAVNVEESEEGVASVAVAVHGPRLAPAAALAVSGPVARMTGEVVEGIEAALRERASWLAAQLSNAT